MSLSNRSLRAALASAAVALVASCDRPASHAWTWSSDAPSRTGLVDVGGDVVLGNEAGALVRLGANGKPVWRTSLGQEIAARPIVSEDIVVAASTGGEWIGVSAADGSPRWKFSGKPAVRLALAGDAHNAYAVAEDKTVLAISAASGATAWLFVGAEGEGPAAGASTRGPAPRIEAAPVRVSDLLVASVPIGLVALTALDGTEAWRQPLRDVKALVGAGERVFAVGADGTVHALRASDGGEEWSRALGDAPSGGAGIASDSLLVGLTDGVLVALHVEDGKDAWRTLLPAPLVGGVAAHGELVLAPTNSPEGRLVALRAGAPKPVFTLRADNALRTAPRVIGNRVVVLASDGRVLAWDLAR